MSWNYRVMEHDGGYSLFEAYYSKEKCFNCSESPIVPYGETVEELRDTLFKMLSAIDAPILEGVDDA